MMWRNAKETIVRGVVDTGDGLFCARWARENMEGGK